MPGFALGLSLAARASEAGSTVPAGTLDFSKADESGLLILLEDI